MKHMNKIAALMLALCLILCLAACGGEDNTETTGSTSALETTAAQETTGAIGETEDDGTVLYTITVVDTDGNPIAGAMVQMCMDTCFPGVTNENGVAEFRVAEADYKVSFLTLPAGYTYSTEEEEFHFADGSTEITLTLAAEG